MIAMIANAPDFLINFSPQIFPINGHANDGTIHRDIKLVKAGLQYNNKGICDANDPIKWLSGSYYDVNVCGRLVDCRLLCRVVHLELDNSLLVGLTCNGRSVGALGCSFPRRLAFSLLHPYLHPAAAELSRPHEALQGNCGERKCL